MHQTSDKGSGDHDDKRRAVPVLSLQAIIIHGFHVNHRNDVYQRQALQIAAATVNL